MQRRSLVGAEDRRPPRSSGLIERARGSDERGDIGDGVPNSVAARRTLRGVCLVEVSTALGIDGDERNVASVGDVTRRRTGGHRGPPTGNRVGLALGGVVESRRDVQFGANRGERCQQPGVIDRQ